MTGHLLAVRWKAGISEDRKPVRWLKAPFWPDFFGHDSVTAYRTVRSVKAFKDASPGHVRHELWHVKQQADVIPWFPALGATLFGIWYKLSKKFRRRIEAAAAAKETDRYPEVRVIREL